MAHTPGPWKEYGSTIPFTRITIHGHGRSGFIASVASGRSESSYSDAMDHETARSNAHLIAAAPDLLEALKLWKCWNEDEKPTGLYFNEIMDKVDAAIAKAEGK